MSRYEHAAENLMVNEAAMAAAVNPDSASASIHGEMVSRNPAPNASPTSAPSGAYRQYNLAHAE